MAGPPTKAFGGDSLKKIKEIISSRLKKLYDYEPYVIQPTKTKKLHLMRIAAKNLRYTLEVLKPVYDERLEEYIQAAKSVQDVLGDVHEMDVWLEFLPEVVEKKKGNKQLTEAALFLEEECKRLRENVYKKFVFQWEKLKERQTWKNLPQTV